MMGFFESLNQLTKPIGVKLFKGGPYDGRDKVYEAGDIYQSLAGIGSKMLGLETPEGDGGVQNLGDMLSGLTGRLNNMSNTGGNYRLRTSQQQQLNQRIGWLGNQRQTALSQAKQRLASRGITGPAYEAALQRINEAYDDMQAQNTTEYTEGARTQELNELGVLLQQLMGMHQYGTGLLTGAAQGKMGVGAAEAQAADTAMQRLGSAIAMAQRMGGLDWALPAHMRTTTKPPDLSTTLDGIFKRYGIVPTVPVGGGSPYVTAPTLSLFGRTPR